MRKGDSTRDADDASKYAGGGCKKESAHCASDCRLYGRLCPPAHTRAYLIFVRTKGRVDPLGFGRLAEYSSFRLSGVVYFSQHAGGYRVTIVAQQLAEER